MMTRDGYVLVIGDTNVDLVVPFPKAGADGKRLPPQPQLLGGGSACNTAHALRRLGQAVQFAGTVGDDAWGRMCIEEMQAAGIGTSGMVVDGALNTVCVFAFVDEDGERYPWPWPEHDQSFRYLDEAKVDMALVDGAAWVHTSGMVFQSDTSARHTVTALLRRAKERGIPTSFDLNMRVGPQGIDGGYRDALLLAAGYSDYLLGAVGEELYPLAAAAGLCPPGAKEFVAMLDGAAALASESCTVIARTGRDGCVAITPKERWVAGTVQTRVVDTVGAGDAFDAGFILAGLQGLPLGEMARYGNAAGSHTVAHKGARATPDGRELGFLLRHMGEVVRVG